MTSQFSIPQIFLWLFIIALGFSLGAGMYETMVVNPLWTSAPPDSVIAYSQHNAANPQFALNPGLKFWIFLTPLTGLLSIATLLSGFRTNPLHRRWRMFGAGLTLLIIIVTFSWFVPNLRMLTGRDVMQMDADALTSLTRLWANLNWGRIVLSLIGWLAVLKALSIPSKNQL